MPVYEVTATVPESCHEKWLEYMKKHVQDLIETKCFEKASMKRVLNDEENVHTYVISYSYSTTDAFEEYKNKYQAQLQTDHKQHFSEVRATRRILDDPLLELFTE